MSPGDSALRKLIDAIAHGDTAGVAQQLAASPALARAQLEDGATRSGPKTHFLEEIGHHLYAGDTALHVAAAAYQPDLVRKLVKAGANVSATNRRGAQPLHYAADGAPGSDRWSPAAQAATIGLLIEAGADPNAFNRSGVAPLHRAVRTRSAAAVKALLEGGADARLRNKMDRPR